MEIGLIGLGRMGKSMAIRLLEKRHKVVVYNRSPEPTREAEKKGAKAAYSLQDFFAQVKKPRIIWVMLPAGAATEEMIQAITPFLEKEDLLIDGGNANYKDTVRRSQELSKKGVSLLDVGTSGGLIGARIGYCLMIGGEKKAFERAEQIFKALATESGYAYVGPSGAGHYVKMVHNAIEYGMMQAMGEGFELLNKSPYSKDIDLKKVSSLWNHGSIVRSFLMEMAENAFSKDSRLEAIEGYVEDTGEGRWAIQEAIERNVPFNAITTSLYARFSSRQKEAFSAKLLAALRNEFGGHQIKNKEK